MIPLGQTKVPKQKYYWGYNVIDNSLSCYGYPWPSYLPPGTFPPGYGPGGPIPGQEQGPLPAQVSPAPAAPGQIDPVPVPPSGVAPPDPLPRVSNPRDRRIRRAQRHQWSLRRSDDGAYPWLRPTLHVANYPTPGMFFDASNPAGRFVFDSPNAFYSAALGSVLSMAGLDPTLAMTRAGEQLRKDIADWMSCGTYNDGLFGTTTVELVGGRQWIGPHGRGINWSPRHGPVRQYIANAKAPYRTTKLDGSRLPNYIEANHRPLAWVPAFDLDVLRNQHQLVPLRWANNRSAIDPPPIVQKLGVDVSGVRFPGGVGCQGLGAHKVKRSARAWWESNR